MLAELCKVLLITAIKTKKNEKLTKTILCSLRSTFLYIM